MPAVAGRPERHGPSRLAGWLDGWFTRLHVALDGHETHPDARRVGQANRLNGGPAAAGQSPSKTQDAGLPKKSVCAGPPRATSSHPAVSAGPERSARLPGGGRGCPSRSLRAEGKPQHLTFVNPQPLKRPFVFARIAEQPARRWPDIPILVVESRTRARGLDQTGVDLSLAKNLFYTGDPPDPRRLLLKEAYQQGGLVGQDDLAVLVGISAKHQHKPSLAQLPVGLT